jgi:hypothetical protein
MFPENLTLLFVIVGGTALLIAFGHRIPGAPDLLWPGHAKELRDAWKQPIQLPPFTIRSIMIAIAGVALTLAFLAMTLKQPPPPPARGTIFPGPSRPVPPKPIRLVDDFEDVEPEPPLYDTPPP